MKNQHPIPNPQVAVTTIDEQSIIVLSDSGQVTVLNTVGTFIWQICDGKHSLEQIVQLVVEEYEVDLSVAERDVAEFIREMVEIKALTLQLESV